MPFPFLFSLMSLGVREESLLLLTLRYKYVGMTVVDSMCPWTFAFFSAD